MCLTLNNYPGLTPPFGGVWHRAMLSLGSPLLWPLNPNHLMHQRWGKGTPILVGPRSLLLLEQAVVLGVICLNGASIFCSNDVTMVSEFLLVRICSPGRSCPRVTAPATLGLPWHNLVVFFWMPATPSAGTNVRLGCFCFAS